jgi:predicted CoA-substrate-specific enzyme activase
MSCISAGWNIGSTSVKQVEIDADGVIQAQIVRHGGDVRNTITKILKNSDSQQKNVVVTGPLALTFFQLPYMPESICAEAALEHLNKKPDLLLSLGGENFIVYCLKDGKITNLVSSSKCAAGSGEFLIQQFARMGFDIEEGLEQARTGKLVKLASRCSVHCKTDATHKLNKGECSAADIAHSLIIDLAKKITKLIDTTNWSKKHIVLMGGLCRNALLVEQLKAALPDSKVNLLLQSEYLESLGAAVIAQKEQRKAPAVTKWLKDKMLRNKDHLQPLRNFTDQVTRLTDEPLPLKSGMKVILGLDAGSTTTKAALIDYATGKFLLGCYLRTQGNPVRAATFCLADLKKQLGAKKITIVQVASTGSGREMTSIFLNNSLSFNEILAHATAAMVYFPKVDTLFEIGGQDAKFVALRHGMPVDYTMNDGCSAGTGSFLEESAASDLQLATEEIGDVAIKADAPEAFGERCAAFINSEIRTALQQGIPKEDIVAGLIYSIVENYVSRVVGTRQIGEAIVLQGGVALNPAVALAVAGRIGAKVVIPPRPELLGAIGAAMMSRDLLQAKQVPACNYDLTSFVQSTTCEKGHFTCKSCANHCEILQVAIKNKVYPFGGLCSKWEMQRRPENLRYKFGEDLISFRHELMFTKFAPPNPKKPQGRIGLPLALTTYELYPFYAKLLTELGYEVVLSQAKPEESSTLAPICYPAEILHGVVGELLQAKVDYIFIPFISSMDAPDGHINAFFCPTTQTAAGIIKQYFNTSLAKFLTPAINLAAKNHTTSQHEIVHMANKLGVDSKLAKSAFQTAWKHQEKFLATYHKEGQKLLAKIPGTKIILVGRPYVAYAPNINMSLPQKIISRGFSVIPGDLLPFNPPKNRHNVWHYTQKILTAIAYAKKHDDCYICYLSCFSCGPDAIFQHRVAKELGTSPFCYLEIDSHSAHAGMETRISAYLEIIEARRQKNYKDSGKQQTEFIPAKMITVEGQSKIVTSEGVELELTDKQIKHVILYNLPDTINKMMTHFNIGVGFKTVAIPQRATDAERQLARRVCSGRECLPFLSIAGIMLRYLASRPKKEITNFIVFDQEGPCVNGNWLDAMPIILE